MSLFQLDQHFFRRQVAMRLDFGDEPSPHQHDGTRSLSPESISTTTPQSDSSSMDTSSWDSSLATPEQGRSPYLSRDSPLSRSPLTSRLSVSPVTSPPRKIEKRLSALRLFEEPRTPRSLLQRQDGRKSRLVGGRLSRTAPGVVRGQRKKSVGANVNPFTPAAQTTKSRREKSGDDLLLDVCDIKSPVAKRLMLRDSNISRYNAEFQEISKIGSGEFGSVYKCRNRLDGCVYALKRSKKPVAGSADEVSAVREVYAHAVLGSHPHIVRYYSAWAEEDHMIIQNEYCNGGSLSSTVDAMTCTGKTFTEDESRQVMLQVAQGLRYIHSMNLAHLDIKPGNIFICHIDQSEEGVAQPVHSSDCCSTEQPHHVIYKIGDMGHVTSTDCPKVEEGDCRYMARELLLEDYRQLQKADVFSLALTVFVMGGGGELHKNGPEWHQIRDGHLPDLSHCSAPFNCLLKSMVQADPAARPSAFSLTQHPVLCPLAMKSKDELRRELNAEKFKNEVLAKELEQAKHAIKAEPTVSSCSRLVGGKSNRKANRSLSVSGW